MAYIGIELVVGLGLASGLGRVVRIRQAIYWHSRKMEFARKLLGSTLEPLHREFRTVQVVWYWISDKKMMLSQLWSNYTGCQSRLMYSLSCAVHTDAWNPQQSSAQRTCLTGFSRSRLRRREDCDQLRPRTMRLWDCGQSFVVCSHTLALLPVIDFQKLSARHKCNRTSRIFSKHFYLSSSSSSMRYLRKQAKWPLFPAIL